MSWYLAAKFLHILAAIMFVGGLFARQLVRRAAKATDDVQFLATVSLVAG